MTRGCGTSDLEIEHFGCATRKVGCMTGIWDTTWSHAKALFMIIGRDLVWLGVNIYSRPLQELKGLLGPSSVPPTLDGIARLLGADLIRDHSRLFEKLKRGKGGQGVWLQG